MLYSFCESVHASGRSPWHIRALTTKGKRLGGGVDTTSLCGLVKPPAGWDLETDFTESWTGVCKNCVAAYKQGASNG
jgi:hypothetical protein